jgi:thiamine-phosphate pyrophosphorylase
MGLAGSSTARRYNGRMRSRHNDLPRVWVVTDARNDAALDAAVRRLPRGSGVIYRHHHLTARQRRRRFAELQRLCRRFGHRLILAGTPRQARRWGADGAYGPPDPGLTLASVHSLREIGRANRLASDALLLSPVYPTRSHLAEPPLGRVRFLLLARRARAPVIALGGMTAQRFRGLPVHGWAAIDAFLPHSPTSERADS